MEQTTQSPQKETEAIAHLLDCNIKQLKYFTKCDPFNPENTVSGYICQREGIHGGSLYITNINNKDLPPQLIYGTPKLKYPYKDFNNYEYKLPKCAQIFISQKWNGMNVLLFKYKDDKGNICISGKSKGTPFLNDGQHGQFASHTRKALEVAQEAKITIDNPLLKELTSPSCQSKTFELCGFEEPHLVKYDFALKLQPLFTTDMEGKLSPCKGLETDFGPKQGWTESEIAKQCKEFQEKDFSSNEEYRKLHNLPHKYEYNHFVIEGRVLYCTDKDGLVLNRTLYKIKPKDIEEVHWSNFDKTMEGRVKEALQKIRERKKPVDEKSFKEELDMGPKEWGRFGKDVMKFVLELSSQNTSFENDARHVIMLCGVAGSGKTYFANKLKEHGWSIIEGNTEAEILKLKGAAVAGAQSRVILDHYFINFQKRKFFLETVKKFKFPNLDVVYFDTDHKLCEERTQQAGKQNVLSTGQFASQCKKIRAPTTREGFQHIYTIKNTKDFEQILNKLK